MFGGPGQIDHLPVGIFQIPASGRVVEIPSPCAVPAPAAHRGPHAFRHRVDQGGEGAPFGRLGVEVFDAAADLARVVPGQLPSADPHQPADPSGEERIGPLPGRQREWLEPERPVSVPAGGQLHVSAPEKLGQPAVGPPRSRMTTRGLYWRAWTRRKFRLKLLPLPVAPRTRVWPTSEPPNRS